MSSYTKLALFVALGLAMLLIFTQFAHAQQSSARIDQVSESFRAAVDGVADKLSGVARNLLLSLLLIELIWKLGKTVREGDDFGQLMGIFFTRVVVAGFFLAIIDGIPTGSGRVGIGTFVIESAEALVGVASPNASIKPSDLFWQMFGAGQRIFDGAVGISGSIAAVVVWLLLSILGAIVVGLMIVTYIEVYVIFTVGILSLGFGVWEVTEQFAKNFLFSAVGKILKLFTMILMASVVATSIKAFGTLSTLEDGLITIGIVVIFAMLMTSVPQAVEQIISGIPAVSSDAAVSSAITGTAQKGARIAGNVATQGAAGAVKSGAQVLGSGLNKMGLNKANVSKAGEALATRIRGIKKE